MTTADVDARLQGIADARLEAVADARLETIIAARCIGKITRQECVEAMRLWREFLPPEIGEYPTARPYVRLAPSPTATRKVEQSERSR